MTDLAFIDPNAAHDQWVREHEWHLALLPDLVEAIVDACLPTIPVGLGSRFDKDQLTGGGYLDNMRTLDAFIVSGGGRIVSQGAAADARELWGELLTYLEAAAQVVSRPIRPVPAVGRTVNADPLTARGEALIAAGWLIDHGDRIAEAPVLDKEPADLFTLIRHLRGRYGVFPHPRRARLALCTICGEAAVRTWWATSSDGRPRSIEVRTCSTCGDEHREDEGKTA